MHRKQPKHFLDETQDQLDLSIKKFEGIMLNLTEKADLWQQSLDELNIILQNLEAALTLAEKILENVALTDSGLRPLKEIRMLINQHLLKFSEVYTKSVFLDPASLEDVCEQIKTLLVQQKSNIELASTNDRAIQDQLAEITRSQQPAKYGVPTLYGACLAQSYTFFTSMHHFIAEQGKKTLDKLKEVEDQTDKRYQALHQRNLTFFKAYQNKIAEKHAQDSQKMVLRKQ